MNKTPLLSSIDILSASGHVGYQWDLTADALVWFGPWQTLFGSSCANPPANASELGAHVFPSDQHLLFSDTDPVFDREYRLRGSNGLPIWIHEHGTTDFENGKAVRQQGLFNIVDHKVDDKDHGLSSDRDSLTGRPNRTCMKDIIEKILQHPREDRKNTAYIAVGLDNLAIVNEGLGTSAGDELLCAFANRLNELCPPRSIICRSSGDSFGILLPGLAKEVEALSQKIMNSFHDHALIIENEPMHISVCIGCLQFDARHNDKATDLMIHTEQALNEARDQGHGNIVTYDGSERRGQKHRAIIGILERVRQALRDNTVRLAFQPIVDANTEETLLYESLARIFYSNGTPIPAGEFIPIVEQMGMAPEFDKHILRLAIKELELAPDLKLTVNISGLSAALPSWPSFVQDLLSNRPDISKRLIIEITETAAVLDIAKMKNLIGSLRAMGSEVALDDFGAGATSIRHLRELDFAVMKIDCELIFGVIDNTEQQHLVRVLISMAQGLGLRTIAEGIENEETAIWLRNEGIDLLQGYYHGRPSFDRPWLKDLKEDGGKKSDGKETAKMAASVPCSEIPSGCI